MNKPRVTSEILDRLPPQNLEAERAVLGSILLDSRTFDDVAAIVGLDDFYAEANAELFRTLAAMIDDRIPVDAMTLLDRLESAGRLESVGGASYLAEVAQSVPFASNAAYYARIVAEKAKLRRIIHAATDALREAYATNQPAKEILNSTEAALAAIESDEQRNGKATLSAKDAAIEVIERIDAICERQEHLGLAIGFERFDMEVGGLFPGEFVVLAARPGVGKTALACQIANYAAQSGKLVYYASLEMTGTELAQRIICGMGDVSSKSIRTGRMNQFEREAIFSAANAFSNGKLELDCRSKLKVYDIRRTARRLHKEGLQLVVIDYLQLLTPSDSKVIREQQVSGMSRELKMMASELKVPVLCLSQLNRATEQQDRPTLGNLRESGAIEQDADMVMFIHRPQTGIVKSRTKGVVEYQPWPAELILEKQRNGETMTFKLDWNANGTKFLAWEPSVASFDNYEPSFDGY